ncbi:RNA-dependent ATPase rok1 [Serendipita sp. 405]|nr:RNA-dependent ATPase rok1 [Serendipita sp. 405]
MEAFQLLTRGSRFDKNRFKTDVQLFKTRPPVEEGKSKLGELPSSLDFFKYAKGGNKMHATKETTQEEDSFSDEDEDRKPQRKRKIDEMDQDEPNTLLHAGHRVTAKGTRIPSQAETFKEMEDRYSIPKNIMFNLESCNYMAPTAVQRATVPILAEGRDLAAISPTGTGKTLAYLLPLFAKLEAPNTKATAHVGKGVRGLVVAPTKELAAQIYNEALKLAQGRKWRIILFSKATASTLKDPAVRDKVDIIISTPLRLVASIQADELQLDNVRFLVLDEADRLLDTEFASQLEEIVALCTHFGCQKSVFSATLPAKAEKTVLDMMNDPIRVVVGTKDTPLPNIHQSFVYAGQPESKLPTLLQYLTSPAGYTPPIIVFVSTQSRVTSLLSELLLAGVKNAEGLHAGMTANERKQCMTRMLEGSIWVLITTDVLARGMDFGGVRGVINFDWPGNVQSYVHRIGRTGRAGREGIAITYFTNDDAPYLKSIVNVLLQSGQSVPEWMLKLQKPSKKKRRLMGKAQQNQPSVGPKGENVGRSLALKKQGMIAGSKRRKVQEDSGFTTIES